MSRWILSATTLADPEQRRRVEREIQRQGFRMPTLTWADLLRPYLP